MEGQEPVGTDLMGLRLPRGAAGSSRMPTTEQSTPQSTAPVARLIDVKSLLHVTPYHGDKASFLGWKWSFLIAVGAISKPLYEGLKKIEDNLNQDFRKSRLSNEDLQLSEQAYTLSALLCSRVKRVLHLRSAEDGNGDQAWHSLFESTNATNLSNQLVERTFTSPDPRINLRQRNKNAWSFRVMIRVKLDSSLQLGKGPVNGGQRSGVPYNFGKNSGTKGQRKHA